MVWFKEMLRNFINIFMVVACLSPLGDVAAVTNKVVCYLGSWSYYRPNDGKFLIDTHIDTNLCTHVIYAFLNINDDGSVKISDTYLDVDLGGFKKLNDLKRSNPNLKTLIAIGGASGAYKYSLAAADPIKRSNWIKSALNLVLAYGFDGFDLDWEYPNPGADVTNFNNLMREFRQAFDPHGLMLTAAVGAAPFRVDLSYDVPSLSKYLDAIHVMTYDLHGTWDDPKTTGQNAPLYASPLDVTDIQTQLNVDACIKHWLKRGADPQKLILGVGTYGRSFQLANPSQNALGAPFIGGGAAGPHTQESGILGYNEICLLLQQGGWREVWDDQQKVPYISKGDQWVGYDNPRSIAIKTEYAKSLNLGGIMIWSLETDDFRGKCGPKNPILTAINTALGTSSENLIPTHKPVPVPTTEPPSKDQQNNPPAPSDNGNSDQQPEPQPQRSTEAPPQQSPGETPNCPKVGLVRDPTNCAAYFYCLEIGSEPIGMPECGKPLVFNEATAACDYPENVKC